MRGIDTASFRAIVSKTESGAVSTPNQDHATRPVPEIVARTRRLPASSLNLQPPPSSSPHKLEIPPNHPVPTVYLSNLHPRHHPSTHLPDPLPPAATSHLRFPARLRS